MILFYFAQFLKIICLYFCTVFTFENKCKEVIKEIMSGDGEKNRGGNTHPSYDKKKTSTFSQ